ncbi:hypothetical protein [Roseiarcus fermentans]|nr:hypothetical protein [Roseiarcus fermentans]
MPNRLRHLGRARPGEENGETRAGAPLWYRATTPEGAADAHRDRESRLRRRRRRLVVELSDIVGLHGEGMTFEAFRQTIAAATADLMSSDDDGTRDMHVEIVAHASAPARAVA